jgi:hypothetical protein
MLSLLFEDREIICTRKKYSTLERGGEESESKHNYCQQCRDGTYYVVYMQQLQSIIMDDDIPRLPHAEYEQIFS